MKDTLVVILVWSVVAVACNTAKGKRNFLFDIGGDRSPAPTGFVKITPATAYAPGTGYGWVKQPDSAFQTINNKILNPLVQDGVMGTDSLVFRADVPNGEYFVTITAGANGVTVSNMRISVNGILLADSMITPWYRLSWKTVRKKVGVRDGKAVVVIAGHATPAGLQGIELRRVTDAQPLIVSNDLEQDTGAVQQLANTLKQSLQQDPNNIAVANQLRTLDNYLLACRYYNMGGWSWATQQTGLSLINRLYIAADLLEQIVADPDGPLYFKSAYLLGKIYYWLNAEDDNMAQARQYLQYFNLLKTVYPNNPVLAMYLGKQIPYDTGMSKAVPGAPQWAVLQREAMGRMLKLIHWWVNEKQTDNGELGGKYGDDVEILRWWLPAILGVDDSIARKGYLRLADGVWNSGYLEKGFAKRIDDVEHSSELFSDTHPAMLLLQYGDPEYVERCMISMQNFMDTWTGITPTGHRHFKSCYLSATAVLEQAPFSVDVPLNARACRPGLMAAWYNHNPAIIKGLSEWSQAWAADAARTDKGKPAGILPAAISFANDGIGGYSNNWYDPQLPYDYYRWESTGHINELQYQLLAMYKMTGNTKLLQPLNKAAELMQQAHAIGPSKKTIPGSIDWAREQLVGGEINSTAKLFSLAKRMTQSTAYDSLIKQYGQPYNKYGITRNKNELIRGFDSLLAALRYNFPMLTSEVKFTDRVYVPGSALITGMYTGHFGLGYEYPSLVASWKNTGREIGILVHAGDQRSALVSLYNFGAPKTVTMNTWQLEPGLYSIRTGIDNNDDDVMDTLLEDRQLTLTERVNAIDLVVPSKKVMVVSIIQKVAFGKLAQQAPDLAIAARDLVLQASSTGKDSSTIQCKVHNIGNITARKVQVELWVDDKKTNPLIIPSIEAPNDLQPCWKMVSFHWKGEPGKHALKIRIVCAQQEITKLNNEVVHEATIR